MIKEYERDLSESDKKVILKEVNETKSYFPKTKKSVLLKLPVLLGFIIAIYNFPTLWLIIPILIISFFMIWMLVMEVKDLARLPKFLKEKVAIIETGIARVREINIDRYAKIKSYNDEGDHYIIERDGKLIMIGGQEFDGVRKLKNKIEYIELMDSSKASVYNTRIIKNGQSLEPYHVFKGKLPEELMNSELWNQLTEQEPFDGKLEDLDKYIQNKAANKV
ncbi:hypothetical protein [Maribacter sp. 1_MG-2023]|uniref:hypothetical protein n=1 Tax=Maribacter sp. 1_MG-2023 TaxID=3062677 RepID=UPI0026E418EA|nr:hypothetical protein [Maribacter sp. 1_MG-2023]MDO6473313.1 hypothetical protein [Maribacter sp. 1_MG-2023]